MTEPRTGNTLQFTESLTEVLILGFKTLFDEWKWLLLKSIRIWEIYQIRKRLQQEYTILGKLHADALMQGFTPDKDDIDLCTKQISFYTKEISTLQQQMQELRQEIVTSRNTW